MSLDRPCAEVLFQTATTFNFSPGLQSATVRGHQNNVLQDSTHRLTAVPDARSRTVHHHWNLGTNHTFECWCYSAVSKCPSCEDLWLEAWKFTYPRQNF